ncbi:YdcF family protein [Paraclostridium bifermentans]|uniref:YdcF family protein n=1 Tax=Paraclostridium bifermentans TaxID=1490 RepID=UPI0018A074A8|nr:YdcF family protein [Paraclostridium bifermentans]
MSRKKKIIILIIVIAVLMVIIGLNLGRFLVESDKLEKADAIAVFSGDSGPRTERAVELLKDGYADYLILSGGKVYDDVTMVELMKNHAIKLGIDESKILIDDEASTTNENAEFTADIIEENNFRSVIVVTSDYHTRRSKLAMKKALENTLIDGEKVEVTVTPSKEEKFTTKWWTSGNSVLMVISEYLKLMGYWVKGYI